MELGLLQKNLDKFHELGVDLIAISSETPDQGSKMKKRTKAAFSFASDQTGLLMDYFNLRHEAGHVVDGSDIFRSASVLIDDNGKVLWSTSATNYRVRPKPETILAEVQKALSATGK